MKIEFLKLQASGNDFIFIEKKDLQLDTNLKSFAKSICDRHFGIGGDGLIIIDDNVKSLDSFKMKILNPDGSSAEICGNALRCFIEYYYCRFSDVSDKRLFVETDSGTRVIDLYESSKNEKTGKINLGKPQFTDFDKDFVYGLIADIFSTSPEIEKRWFQIEFVDIGNPHLVFIARDEIKKEFMEKSAYLLEKAPIFPNKTNVELVEVIDRENIKITVWERGVGFTLSCGSGVGASFFAAESLNLIGKKVTALLPGGNMFVEINSDADVLIHGKGELVFHGVYYLDDYKKSTDKRISEKID